ncbi:MAG: glycosyltransferase family 2 protein [Polyangiaceae bacterium]|jgi:glycosyltransferase involved in cell wall biosynthesis|nr:glycosyltransferase family 2 protein [Polyangiaceae bacterium]
MIHHAHIAVVVPAHNEARFIARVLARMPAFVDSIVVVDDASSDATATIAASWPDPRVRLSRHAVNRGVGAAIATGYRAARAAGADVIAVMAGDDQMDPADLATVVAPVCEGRAHYVKGNRLRHAEARRMPAARRLGSTVLGWATAAAVRVPALGDSQCGYTAISGHALDAIDLGTMWPGFGYPNDLLGLLRARGFVVAEVVVRPIYADEISELSMRHLPIIAWLIARAAWRVRLAPHTRLAVSRTVPAAVHADDTAPASARRPRSATTPHTPVTRRSSAA